MNWFIKSLEGPKGGISSTRINVYALLLLFILITVANVFLGKTILPALLDYLIVLILGFAGLKTVDGGLNNNKEIQINKALNGKPDTNVNTVINKNEGADVTQVVVDGQPTQQ